MSPDNHKDLKLGCRICGSEKQHATHTAREMMFGTREEFDYFQCAECECLQIREIPSDLGKYYPPGYGGHSLNRRKHAGIFLAYLQKQRYRNALFGRGYKINRALSGFVPITQYRVDEALSVAEYLNIAGVESFNARFLDVGCGNWSKWLEYLKAMGFWRLMGIDPLISTGAQDLGIVIRKQSIQEADGNFDVITYHHSLEHIENQHDQFINVKRLLAPDGVLIVRIPVVSGHAWKRYGTDWVELDAPRHLYLHSHKSISALAEKAGFRLIKYICDSTEFEFYASEQYKIDVPLTGATSHWKNPQSSIFSENDINAFRESARTLNESGQGGRAAFFFQAI